MTLYHLSELPDIARFDPRPSAYTDQPAVWAISAERIANYLVPRDCPRVCFRAGPQTTATDITRHLEDHRPVVAIEARWLERLRTGRLYRYAMPREGFVMQDEDAGYWVAHQPVTPLGVDKVEDLAAAIARAGATLRVLLSLWALHDEIRASSLVYSMIRMRNAQPR
ncbi:DUF6886 family protein [uncultured Devosia sp.]|uniref:DUF6886 family protein n=1 Tax=uncultured Devosia sp. TaxID=211434 RepID=UPI0026093FA7|nr:DUF6886 family protein [uncultured Devosia sp.]